MREVRRRSDGAQQGVAFERVEATVKMTRMLSAAERVGRRRRLQSTL
jgi:hypothetical protein